MENATLKGKKSLPGTAFSIKEGMVCKELPGKQLMLRLDDAFRLGVNIVITKYYNCILAFSPIRKGKNLSRYSKKPGRFIQRNPMFCCNKLKISGLNL